MNEPLDANSIWVNAPQWLLDAYHKDALVHATTKRALVLHQTEREYLLSLVQALLENRIHRLDNVESFYSSYFREKLPNPDHVGRKFRIQNGTKGSSSQIHTVLGHYIDEDDCSGTYGMAKYEYLSQYPNNNSFAVCAKDCELLDA